MANCGLSIFLALHFHSLVCAQSEISSSRYPNGLVRRLCGQRHLPLGLRAWVDPRTHMVEGQSWRPRAALWPPHTRTPTQAHPHVYTLTRVHMHTGWRTQYPYVTNNTDTHSTLPRVFFWVDSLLPFSAKPPKDRDQIESLWLMCPKH